MVKLGNCQCGETKALDFAVLDKCYVCECGEVIHNSYMLIRHHEPCPFRKRGVKV